MNALKKLRVGLLGFGKTGSIVAKELVADPNIDLQWVCRRQVSPELKFASHALGFDKDFSPFVEFSNFSEKFLKSNPVDLVFDFSSNSALSIYEILANSKVKVVSAISKYADEDIEHIKKVSQKTAILYSPNITLGINWVIIASKILKSIIPHADIEVVEEHFRDKKEVSGTAMRIADHLKLDTDKHISSIRVGGIIGKHEVIFGLPHQTIRLTHESINRSAFGTGAIFAGKWLIDRENGLYSMEQVFHEKFLKKFNELNFA